MKSIIINLNYIVEFKLVPQIIKKMKVASKVFSEEDPERIELGILMKEAVCAKRVFVKKQLNIIVLSWIIK